MKENGFADSYDDRPEARILAVLALLCDRLQEAQKAPRISETPAAAPYGHINHSGRTPLNPPLLPLLRKPPNPKFNAGRVQDGPYPVEELHR